MFGNYPHRLLHNLEKSENWIEVGKIQKIKKWGNVMAVSGSLCDGMWNFKFCNLYDQETSLLHLKKITNMICRMSKKMGEELQLFFEKVAKLPSLREE